MLVSPSTVIWLKLFYQPLDSALLPEKGETAASQVAKASIVAMLG